MDVIKALKNRKCVRKFLDKEIPQEVLNEVFEVAKWSPSSKNTQPWKIVVVSGQRKIKLMEKLTQAFDNGQKPAMEYDYNGGRLEGKLRERAVKCGQDLYSALEISRGDKEKRLKQWRDNYLSFNSPTAIFIFKHPDTGISGYMDCGMLIQSITLTALGLGLATCPQASLGEYPEIVKQDLGCKDYTLICGIAIGYEDTQAKVNNYRTEREPLENIVDFF